MNSENAISHIHVNKRSLGLVTTILALLQNTQVMRRPRTSGGYAHILTKGQIKMFLYNVSIKTPILLTLLSMYEMLHDLHF